MVFVLYVAKIPFFMVLGKKSAKKDCHIVLLH